PTQEEPPMTEQQTIPVQAADINRATEDSERGRTLKPIRLSGSGARQAEFPERRVGQYSRPRSFSDAYQESP
ncbi:hypothetical protein, partial [Deinococcus wulumuqiensis]|uniref:hypothetical protein n=1 Tax=Deinococcus wulumuqiensis TaxID=980427 RepID=UPI00243304F9